MTTDKKKSCIGEQSSRIAALFLFISILSCSILAVWVNLHKHMDIIYTHLFYIPIVIAGSRFPRLAVPMAVMLGMVHISCDLADNGAFRIAPMLRSSVFIFVAWYVSSMTGKLERIRRENMSTSLSLKESRERFMKILYSSSDAILLVAENRFIDCNEAAVRMLGYRGKDDVLLRHPSDISPPYQADGRDSREMADEMMGLAQEKGFHRFEWIHRRAGGEDFLAEVSLTPIVLEGKNILYCVIRDIDEQKREEENRRQRTIRQQRQAEVISEIASDANLAEGAVRELVRDLTEAASDVLDVERVGVWLFNSDGTMMICIDNYIRSRGTHETGHVLYEKEFSAEFEILRTTQYIDANDAINDPRTSAYVEGYLKPNHITSMLDAVIWAEGRGMGTLCFEHVNKAHTWQDDEISFACRLADQVALALLHSERKQAQVALLESYNRYNQLAEQSRTFTWEVNADALYTYVSPIVERITGYRPQDLTGKSHLHDLHPVEGREEFIDEMSGIIRSRSDFRELQNPVRTRDGGLLWISSNGIPVLDDDGSLRGYRGSSTDITERKKLEQEISLRKDQFESLVKSFPGTVYQCRYDRDWTMLYMSREVDPITGYPTVEFINNSVRTYESVIHPDDRNYVHMAISEAIGRNRFWKIEYRVLHRYGGIRWVHEEGWAIIDNDSSVKQLDGYLFDITDRKQAEEELRKAQFSVEYSALPTLWFDRQSRVMFVNDATCRSLGYTREELMNMTVRDFDPDFQSKKKWDRIWNLISRHGQYYRMETRHRRKDGTIFPVEVLSNFFSFEGQEYIFSFVTDITDRKQAEEEKEKLLMQLAQSQKMESIGRLAGGVAHDFNNMLGAIMGYTQMSLRKLDPDHPVYPYQQEIVKAAERSANLTRQLLAFARKQTIAPKLVDLNATVEGMLKMLRRIIGEDIELVWRPHEGTCPVMIDPSQVDQILANLCINARDAIGESGRIVIATGLENFDGARCVKHIGCVPGEYVLLSVSDNGHGMDRDTLSHIFEPFYTTKETGKGTGLGLATVYGCVTQNRGIIEVKSEQGQGSVFSIYLPLYMVKSNLVPGEWEQEKPEDNWNRPVHETVLLVEDERMLLDMNREILEELGYHVLSATDPDMAIGIAGDYAGKIDLLITDVVMPGMNGQELGKRILSLYPDIKLLFMSGYTSDIIAHHGVLDDGVHFIQKPFTIRDLAVKIRETLAGR